ncbi:hypothetical protein ACP4OV_031687 [Aristida adscensionis]
MGSYRYHLYDASLKPPALSAADDAAAREALPWVLLELQAFVSRRRNATTASTKTKDGEQISVTFFPRRPPRVSYICVDSPHAEFPIEPQILAVEDDLVLLRLSVAPPNDVPDNFDYLVYLADDGSGRPSLDLLPRPPRAFKFDTRNMGLLRCRATQRPPVQAQAGVFPRPHRPASGLVRCSTTQRRRDQAQAAVFLRPHGPSSSSSSSSSSSDYAVVGFRCSTPPDNPGFAICIYRSWLPADGWTTHVFPLDQQPHLGSDFDHVNTKVISIGGDGGTMGFVDLWRGILFCDVLQPQGHNFPPLRYVPLPVVIPRRKQGGDACLARDIAVVHHGSCRVIKFVELLVHRKPSKVFRGLRLNDGWRATTFTRPATSSPEHSWSKCNVVDSNSIHLENNPHVDLLPKVLNDEDMLLPPFKRLDICQPTLGLHEDDGDIIYLMIKVSHEDKDAWVVAVDMKKNNIEGVSQFSAERNLFITFSFMHSRISKHLKASEETMDLD